ncbi:hypothetical protein VM98_34295, partial [Streptomyces rubellomurinus subsp. indigoferus]
RVQDEMIAGLRFWLDLGIDGFRLDAVPYLFARERTNCENLPETHQSLQRLRKETDAYHPDPVLLAEGNQWPKDAVAYSGDLAARGDACHTAVAFPVTPRVLIAVRPTHGHARLRGSVSSTAAAAP